MGQKARSANQFNKISQPQQRNKKKNKLKSKLHDVEHTSLHLHILYDYPTICDQPK